MRANIAVVLSGVLVAMALTNGVALASDDTEGGECRYGDASVNLFPTCDTSRGGRQVSEDPLSDYRTDPPPLLGEVPMYPRDLPSAPPTSHGPGTGAGHGRGDTEGGGCEYGDASLNLAPSCETSSEGGLPNYTDLFHPRTGQLVG